MISGAKKRVFLAIDLPKNQKDEIGEKLEKLGDLPIRILPESMWHITVLFLGYLNIKDVEILKMTVESLIKNKSSFSMVLEKLMWAPPQRTPRMLWLSFVQSKEFSELAIFLEKEIIKKQKEGVFGQFRKSNRPPHPHITLSRFHEENWPLIQKDMEKKKIALPVVEGIFEVKSIDIMESQLSREGAEYSKIGGFPFLNYAR